jgi:hypothetical protein
MRLRIRVGVLGACALLAVAACSSGGGSGWGSPGGGPLHDDGDGGTSPPAGDDGGTSTPPAPTTGNPPPSGQPDSGAAPVDASSPQGGHDAASPPPANDASVPPQNGFDQFQNHNLDVINMYRATLSVAPLVLDQQLCSFALAGSQELSMDHLPHQHFINASNDGSLWNDGFNMSAAENQGDPNGWPQLASDPTQNELDQIDGIQKAMFDEGPGAGEAHGHYTNMMNPDYHRLGVGLLEVGGQLYLTNDFSQ